MGCSFRVLKWLAIGKASMTCCNDVLLCTAQSIHAWACGNTRERLPWQVVSCVVSVHLSIMSVSTASVTTLSMPTHSTHQKAKLRLVCPQTDRQTDRQTSHKHICGLQGMLPGTTTTFSSFSLSRISSASLMPPHSFSQANMPA